MDFAPLRHRDYRLLFVAQSVSLLGTMVSYVALPFQMYRLTHSSLSVGLLGLAELVPLLLTAFLGGALADAMDKRRLVIVTDAMLAAGSVSLAVVALHGQSVWMLYLLAAWMAAISALQRPSLEALVPRLVTPADVPAAATLATFRGSLGMIAGPAIGGALLASAGLAATYAVDAVSYLCSLVCLWMIRSIRPPENPEPPSLAAVVDGFRYAKSRQELIGTYVVDFVAMVFGMPLALFPALSDLLGGPHALGLLYAAPGVRRARRECHGPLGAARAPPRTGNHGGGDDLGCGDRGLRAVADAVARPAVPCSRRRRRRHQRHLPNDDLESDHSGSPARTPRQHRNGELLERSASGQCRGRDGGRGVWRSNVGCLWRTALRCRCDRVRAAAASVRQLSAGGIDARGGNSANRRCHEPCALRHEPWYRIAP